MPRYEFSEGGVTGAHKFWEVSVQGPQMTIRFGRIGSRGQTQLKTFGSTDEARAAAEKVSLEKVRKGYVLVEGTGPAPTAPAPEPPPSPEAPPPPASPTNPELLEAIAANPDDDQAYLVYSDWLQTQGDPRGELIAIQAQMKGQSNPARFLELKKADAAIMQAHERRLLGTLADVLHEVRIGWRNGFIRSATVTDKGNGLAGALGALLQSPSAPFLQELALVAYQEAAYQEAIALLASRLPQTLRNLALGAGLAGGTSPLGDLAPLLRAATRLRKLVLRGRGARFDAASLPELARLELRASDLESGAALPTLGAMPWPSLERLLLRADRSRLASLAPLRPIFEGRSAPRLTHLHLERLTPAAADALVTAIAEGPLAARLELLEMSESVCGSAAATALLDHRAAFERMTVHLWLDAPPKRIQELTKTFPRSRFFATRRRASDEREDGGEGDDRDDGIQE